jgi:superfamily II DNA helicase RecQ
MKDPILLLRSICLLFFNRALRVDCCTTQRAVFLSSMQDNAEIQAVIHELQSYCYGGYNNIGDEESKIKMLYITPEKFSKSEQLNRLLVKLADCRLLSRFVIDEAHCLSQVDAGSLGCFLL